MPSPFQEDFSGCVYGQPVTSANTAVTFAKELETGARLYAALLNSQHDFWTGWGSSTKDNIDVAGEPTSAACPAYR